MMNRKAKRILCAALACVTALSLTACGSSKKHGERL